MGIVKEVIQDLIERHNTKKQCRSAYIQIRDELYSYLNDLEEIEKLKRETGHTHFKTKEVEEKVLRLIDEDDRVLTIIGIGGENIGMEACRCKLENIVLRALDNEEANTQVDLAGENIGMFAARYGLENAVIKALDNHEASIQQGNLNHDNIGMLAAKEGMEMAVLKALENKVASTQQNLNGDNIGILAASKSLEVATIKALDNEEACRQSNFLRFNIGIFSALYGMEEATLKSLDYDFLRTSRNCNGRCLIDYVLTSDMDKAKEKLEKENLGYGEVIEQDF